MDTKTREQYLRGKPPRHRLTVPNHTIKALAHKLAFEAQRGLKPKRKADGRVKAKAVARRKFTPAHWEGDLINGLRGTGNLVTLVERMSRFTLVGYSATKETDAVMAVFKALLKGLPQEMVQSLTLDNGKEYSKFKVLVRECGLAVFFAKPYHSWERGTNENRNGIVRIVLPKGSRFDNIAKEQMERIDRLLNDRPLRCLGWRTPREVFMARLKYRLDAA